MMDDQKVAITQTPQFFKERVEHTWIERGASQVQEMFYRWCQVCAILLSNMPFIITTPFLGQSKQMGSFHMCWE
jgi:hypothetical protein